MKEHPILTPILIRDLTNAVPVGQTLNLFVLPAGKASFQGYAAIDCYFYGQAATNSRPFTNRFTVTATGVARTPSPPPARNVTEKKLRI